MTEAKKEKPAELDAVIEFPESLEFQDAPEFIVNEEDRNLENSFDKKNVRSLIRKMLRPFHSRFRHDFDVLQKNYFLLCSTIIQRVNLKTTELRSEITALDKRFAGLYSALVNGILAPFDRKIANNMTSIESLAENVAKKLHEIENAAGTQTVELEEYIKTFKEKIEGRSSELFKILLDDKIKTSKEKILNANKDNLK